MIEKFVDLVSKVLPIGAVIFLIIRFFITTTNKTEIDILLTPRMTRYWEDFQEVIVLSLFIVPFLNVSLVFSKSGLPNIILEYFFYLATGLYILSTVIVFISWITSFIVTIKNSRIVNFSIYTNYLSIIGILVAISLYSRDFFKQIVTEGKLVNYSLIIIAELAFFIIIFYFYRRLFQHFNRINKNHYKIERIPAEYINNELQNLFVSHVIDTERHVLSTSRNSKLEFPVYIFYPKENSLVKYYKES